MMLAIESLVRACESLLDRMSTGRSLPAIPAANDNTEMSEEDRRWAAYR